LALECVNAVDARSVVLAWTAQTFIDVDIAMVPRETWPAEAVVAALGVDANTVVAQRVTVQFTFVHIDVAELTCEGNFTLLDFREKQEWFYAPRFAFTSEIHTRYYIFQKNKNMYF